MSIIGTRPQYIKIKPIYDYCEIASRDHLILDTGQHYDRKMSQDIIDDLGLAVDKTLNHRPDVDKLEWICSTVSLLRDEIERLPNAKVLIYGDTDSAFCAALACNRMGVSFGHIEAGARCWNRAVPEEVNRMYVDSVARVNFCSTKKDIKNVENGLVVGDLEYELLNDLNPTVFDGDFVVMTLHRKENMRRCRVQKVFDFVSTIPFAVHLITHHSLMKKEWFGNLSIPLNAKLFDPLPYTVMVDKLASCKFILTDSGSVPKLAPFFGKRCLVLRNEIGWTETLESGHCRLAHLNQSDVEWLEGSAVRERGFYLFGTTPSAQIVDTMLQCT